MWPWQAVRFGCFQIEMDWPLARRAPLSSLLPLLLRQRSLAETFFILCPMSPERLTAQGMGCCPGTCTCSCWARLDGVGIQVQLACIGNLCFSSCQPWRMTLAVKRTTFLTSVAHFHWVLGETKQKYLSWHTCSFQWKVVLLEKLQSTVSCDWKTKIAEHCDLCLFHKGATTKNQTVPLFHNLNGKDLYRK